MFVMPSVYNSGDTVYFFFDAYDSAGASVTITGLAVTDIEVYKDGSTTQRASDNGYALLDTDGIDFDGTTGLHGFSIDTSDNSDAGFWTDGAQYLVNVNAVTIDGQTVRFSYFLTLGRALRPSTAGRKLAVSAGGAADANLVSSLGVAITNYDGTLAAVTADTDITFPATDAAGNAVPDSAHEYTIIKLGAGTTGGGQLLFTTTRAGTRKYNFVDAWTPTNPDNTTTYEVVGSWRALAEYLADAAANKAADHTLRRKFIHVEASADGDAIDNSQSLYGTCRQQKYSDVTTNAGYITVYTTAGAELERIPYTSAPADPITGWGGPVTGT